MRQQRRCNQRQHRVCTSPAACRAWQLKPFDCADVYNTTVWHFVKLSSELAKLRMKRRLLLVTLSHEDALSRSETLQIICSGGDAQREAIKLPVKGLLIDVIVSSALGDSCMMSKMAGRVRPEFVCNCFRIRRFSSNRMEIDFFRVEKMENFLPQCHRWISFHEMKKSLKICFLLEGKFPGQ